MAINYGILLENARQLQGKVNELFSLIGVAKEAKVRVTELGEDIPFTTVQKQALLDKYLILLAEIKTLVNGFPVA